jgi:hypothetical protein
LSLTKPPDNSVPCTNRLKYQNNILFTKHVQDKKLFNTGKVCPVLFCLILIFSNQTDPWGVTNRVYLWNRTCKSSLLYISENWYKDFRLALIDLWLWILVRRTDVTDWLIFCWIISNQDTIHFQWRWCLNAAWCNDVYKHDLNPITWLLNLVQVVFAMFIVFPCLQN